MDDQDDAPRNPGPFAHLARGPETRSPREIEIAEFNKHKRRRGSKKRWHDYFPENAANDPDRE